MDFMDEQVLSKNGLLIGLSHRGKSTDKAAMLIPIGGQGGVAWAN